MPIKMATINLKKRKEAQDIVYKVMDALDPTGANSKKYKKMFGAMSNDEFTKFMKAMWEDDTLNFTLDIVGFERELTLEQVENAAKIIGVPLEEYVMLPFLNNDIENPIVTKVPVFVMNIIFKRLQQMTRKKNSASTHIGERSATTNQVINDDKNGRSSDVENAALIAQGAVNSAKEFNGFRADGIRRKNAAYASATTKGYISLEEVEAVGGISDRTVLNTVDALYIGMGIKTDLVDESLIMKRSLSSI